MNTNGEAAEQVTRIILEGTEVLLRLSGKGAARAAVLLYTTLRQQEKTKGAARLSNMLRSGKPLRVYTFESKDLPKFKEVAKQYGVLYSILKEKDKTGGVFDVMVRADDEHKLNRIIERFNLTRLDTTTLKVELEKEKKDREAASQEKGEDKETEARSGETREPVSETEPSEKSSGDRVADELLGASEQKDMKVQGNPEAARTDGAEGLSNELTTREISPLSEPSSTDEKSHTDRRKGASNRADGKKPSVRKKLEVLKRERAERIKRTSMPINKESIKTGKAKDR